LGKRRGSGLFKPPRWKYLAEVVTFEDPKKARKAAAEILRSIKKAKRRDKALREARALQYAANRARAAARKRGLSRKEREELREVAKVYEEAAKEAWEIYREKYGG